jgi:hypothetical protein
VLKKFYRGNNITNGVTFAKENLTFVVTQSGWPGSQGWKDADSMTPLYCRETLI